MKRWMTAVCCACALGTIGVAAAQADKMGQSDKMSKMDKMSSGAKPTVVTGCVAESGGHYLLNNAMTAGDTKAMTYDLTGGDLKAHVGHKVEVTGTRDSKMGKMSKDKMAGDKMANDKMGGDKMMASDKMAAADAHAALTVTSVKMIAATCP